MLGPNPRIVANPKQEKKNLRYNLLGPIGKTLPIWKSIIVSTDQRVRQ